MIWTFEQMDGLAGRLAFAAPPETVAAMFPAASGWLGPRRLAALAASHPAGRDGVPGAALDI